MALDDAVYEIVDVEVQIIEDGVQVTLYEDGIELGLKNLYVALEDGETLDEALDGNYYLRAMIEVSTDLHDSVYALW